MDNLKFNVDFDKHFVQIAHHFGDDGSGIYIKETAIPKGVSLGMHTHTFTHKSVLVSGEVLLNLNGFDMKIKAPYILTVEIGELHTVTAIENSIWLCIHKTDVCDESEIDNVLIGN